MLLTHSLTRFLFSCITLSLTAWATHAQEIPWHLGAFDKNEIAPAAINTAPIKPGPHKVVIAVIDSGVISDHPSLMGQLLPGYDMISPPNNLRGGRSSDYSPDTREARCGQRLVSSAFRTHGTEVTSLIVGNGQDGVRGVNPAAKVVPVRLFGACNMSRKDLLDSIAWAAGFHVDGVPDNPNPARVINMSIAGGLSVCGNDLQQLINQVISKNIYVVAAAGNNFRKPLSEPANCRGVVSVGAIDAENNIEVYSALDPRTSIYAPGGGKKLTGEQAWTVNKLKIATYELDWLGSEKATAPYRGVGTSYAAPIVAGFVSLWLSYEPSKKPMDFTSEIAKFLRAVPLLEQCPNCSPQGLAVLTERWP